MLHDTGLNVYYAWFHIQDYPLFDSSLEIATIQTLLLVPSRHWGCRLGITYTSERFTYGF